MILTVRIIVGVLDKNMVITKLVNDSYFDPSMISIFVNKKFVLIPRSCLKVPTQSDDFCEESANFWVIRVKISPRGVRRECSQREERGERGHQVLRCLAVSVKGIVMRSDY